MNARGWSAKSKAVRVGFKYSKPSSLKRGEHLPNHLVCSEWKNKLNVRRVDPERRNGAYAGQEIELAVSAVSREPRLKNQPCFADVGMLASQGEESAAAVRPFPERPAAPEAPASVSSEREDSCGTPAHSLTPQEKTASFTKATVSSPISASTFPPSLSLSQKPSPDSHISLHPFRQSPAGPVLTPVCEPSSAASGEGVNSHCSATTGKMGDTEAATPARSLSETTKLNSVSTWKRKLRSKRKHSRKCKKYVKKSGTGAWKAAEQLASTAELPDLEDVEGMLFVSFASKEALQTHLGGLPLCRESVPQKEKANPPARTATEVEEKIAQIQGRLLLDQQRLKIKQTALEEEGARFLSRTGKTKDLTKIKGWREKFVSSEISSLNLADADTAAGAVAGVEAERHHRSAFCSDMLDEYLEREGPLMDRQAAESSSPSSLPLLLYQLPSSSSSYIRPLHTVLSKRAPKPTTASLPLNPPPVCPMPQPKPKPKPERPLSAAKGPLTKSYSAKAAAKSLAAAKRVLAPPPSSVEPYQQEASMRRALFKVLLKLKDLENRALWEGESQTTITNERAEQALSALLTAQGFLKRNRVHAKPSPSQPPPCRQAFCRLGCVCASLAKGRRIITHCRKPACMFGCSCLKHKMVLVRPSQTSPPRPIGQKTPGQVGPSNCKSEQGDLIGQKTAGEVCPSNSEPEQGDLIGQKTEEVCPSNFRPEQGDLIGQKTEEVCPSNSEPGRDDLIGQEPTGEACPSSSEPGLGDLIGQKTLGEACPSSSEPGQDDLIGEEPTGEGCPSNSEPGLGDLIKQETMGAGFPSTRDLIALEMIGEHSTLYHKKKMKKKKKKKRKKGKRGRPSYAILEAEPEVEMEVKPAVHPHRLWNRKEGEVDPEPLYIPKPELPPAIVHAPKPARGRTCPDPVVRDEDKGPVYLYFESLMTCARVREYMSKPPPERPLCICKSVLCSGKEDDPYHYSNHLTEEKQQPAAKTRPPQPPQKEEDPWRTLEVLSECDWRSEQGRILTAVCHRAAQGNLTQPFSIGPFLIRPFGPALRKEGDARSFARKVLISRLPEGSTPVYPQKAPVRDRASKALPIWSDILPAGLLTARKKEPGLPAKGLIKVNGKSYSQAKLHLGQMGALHMTSRLAAYLTGRWQPANQKRSVKATPISKSTIRSSSESCSPLPACFTGAVTPESTSTATSTSGPVLKPLVSPAASVLLVPVEGPDSDAAALPSADSPAPPSPGESVVVHPINVPSGTPLFRHPSGRLVHLMPLKQVYPAPPNLTPGADTHLPRPLPPSRPSASADTGVSSPTPTALVSPAVPTETRPSTLTIISPAAAKPAPGFLAQRGTRTIRISPGSASRTPSKRPAPVGFTPLHVPRGTLPPRELRKEPEPPKTRSPENPGLKPQTTAKKDNVGSGHSAGERWFQAATPKPAKTHQSRVITPVHRLATTALAASAQMPGGARSDSGVSERRVVLGDVSEDSEEDCVGKMSDEEVEEQEDSDYVDVETVEELHEEKRTQTGLIQQADSQAEPGKNLIERLHHTELERRRRSQIADQFTQLQEVLGMESMSKTSRAHVLSRAVEEIQTLERQCNLLEEEKRLMMQKRQVFIKEIAQRSGKAEELILLKLQDISAKQKSLESKRKKAQQRPPGPDRKQSPTTPASETEAFLLPKILSVRSLATSPLITTATGKQDKQSS